MSTYAKKVEDTKQYHRRRARRGRLFRVVLLGGTFGAWALVFVAAWVTNPVILALACCAALLGHVCFLTMRFSHA